MAADLGASWWRRVGYHFVVSVASEAAAKWLLFVGAALIAASTYFGQRVVLHYGTVPPHAIVYTSILSALVGVSILLSLTLILNRKNQLVRTGLRRVFPVRAYNKPDAPPSTRHLDRTIGEIRRIIRETPAAETCRLLLVSGFYYLGAPEMPGSPRHFLGDIQIPAKVRILLLNPFPERCDPCWAERRAGEVGHGAERGAEYLRGIRRVAEHLVSLRRDHGRDIQVGFYNAWPAWQLFLNSREGVVQPVDIGRHSQYNPLYHLQYTSGSLFVPLQRHFEILWQAWEEELTDHRRFYEQHGIVVSRGKKKALASNSQPSGA